MFSHHGCAGQRLAKDLAQGWPGLRPGEFEELFQLPLLQHHTHLMIGQGKIPLRPHKSHLRPKSHNLLFALEEAALQLFGVRSEGR